MIGLQTIRQRLNDYLQSDLSFDSRHSTQLSDGMKYAVLNGGKRLRGSMVCASAIGLNESLEAALRPAAAVEYLHAYSLVHDDLPDMDDASIRRGKPSCHAAFGTTTAILVGDALQSLAYETLAKCGELTSQQRVHALQVLLEAGGWANMVGGQAMDMELENRTVADSSTLDVLNDAKTGALFRASAEIGSVVAGFDPATTEFQSLSEFAGFVGAAFQITDDILDATQRSDILGKPAQADGTAGKLNYVTHIGVEGAQIKAKKLLDNAFEVLERMDMRDSILAEIANLCVNRSK